MRVWSARLAAAFTGVPALEDKIVQSAIAELLSAIYETDFLGFSYGFRPGEIRTWRLTRFTRRS